MASHFAGSRRWQTQAERVPSMLARVPRNSCLVCRRGLALLRTRLRPTSAVPDNRVAAAPAVVVVVARAAPLPEQAMVAAADHGPARAEEGTVHGAAMNAPPLHGALVLHRVQASARVRVL